MPIASSCSVFDISYYNFIGSVHPAVTTLQLYNIFSEDAYAVPGFISFPQLFLKQNHPRNLYQVPSGSLRFPFAYSEKVSLVRTLYNTGLYLMSFTKKDRIYRVLSLQTEENRIYFRLYFNF